MLRNLIRRFEQRFPETAAWTLGDRPEVELPALGVSLFVHAAALLALALVGYANRDEGDRTFRSQMVDTTLPEFSRVEIQDLDLEEELAVVDAGSVAPELGAVLDASPVLASALPTAGPAAPAGAPQLLAASVEIRRPGELGLPPMAANLGQMIDIQGTGAEHVGDVEGAVDRVAVEVVRRLQQRGRTLVVWAFDASGSLQAERDRLGKHIERVYQHIGQLDSEGLSRDGGLLSMVVAFGQARKAMLEEPTADVPAIISAVREVPLDESGVESTFGTVAELARRWGKFKDAQGEKYSTVAIVVTDEVGDDETRLEEAIAAAEQARMPVYVLGSPALFGRAEGYMDYTDPRTKQFFPRVPVRQGPEAVMLEGIRLPFWYDGPQYDNLDAGFGPHALSRLAGATGGIYFVTRLGPGHISFDPNRMREYRPDWVSREDYAASLARHPLRKAVIDASLLTRQRVGPQPSLVFPPVDGPEFKDAMTDNQALAALTASTVDEALGPITAVARLRDRETSRRWQAHYDLIRGRLLAMKIRCYEYNWACATMKRDAPKFTRPNSNAWRLVPDEEIHYSDKAKAAGDEARKLLQRVIDDHPGTPWALLAQRELKDPFGFKWVETTLPPRRRMEPSNAAVKKAMTPKSNTKPPEPPKL